MILSDSEILRIIKDEAFINADIENATKICSFTRTSGQVSH